MKAGIVGTVAGDFSRVEPLRKLRVKQGQELTDQIEVTGVRRTSNGTDINEGHAAREELASAQRVTLGNDSIAVEDDATIETNYTEFAAIPGSVVVVSSKRGQFLFDLIGEETDTSIERASIDVTGFMEQFDDISPWQVGFYDATGPTQKGTLYGDDVLTDGVADILEDATINQLGAHVALNGTSVNVSITESGYVGVYEPTDFSTIDYLSFIAEAVNPYID